jgi:hypothetical protein
MMRKKTKKITPSESRQRIDNPLKVNMARIFFCLNGILWLGYVVYIYYDMAVRNNNLSAADIVTLFAFVNAGLLIFSGIKFGKPQQWVYYFPLAVVVFNTLLSLLNIVDLYFLVSFILDLIILWAILPLRKNYLSNP